MNQEKLNQYLQRIEMEKGGLGEEALLKKLHRQHTYYVPFENLDQLAGESISLQEDDLYEKIVKKERGGYCFELNGAFKKLLEALGFAVKTHMARVYIGELGYSPKTHQVNTVQIGSQFWLADVGFGGNGPQEAVLLEEGKEQVQSQGIYKVTKDAVHGWILHLKKEKDFQPIYAFTMEEYLAGDFDVANYFTATHPDSLFTQALVCTKTTEEGRVTLFNRQMKRYRKNGLEEEEVKKITDLKRILKQEFFISEDEIDAKEEMLERVL